MKLLKSGTIAKQIKEQIFDKVSMLALHHFIPQLCILWIGDDSSSEWFINSKIDWHIDEKGHSFEDAVNLALSDYQIVKKVEHGVLKALLYQKMN